METYEQITLDQWVQWKEDIRRKLEETAQNFVHIGFRLKQIRDSGMYGGAADIFEFAEREYGLGKSTVSRFIAINERYSEGGNSLELKKEFRAFSSSKLSEMLTLPDNEIQLVTEKTTIREIRELKEFNRQEDPGEAEEGKTQGQQDTGTDQETDNKPSPLEKCILDFFRDKREALNRIIGILSGDQPQYQEAMERMNPSGQASHKKGIVFLFLYDWGTGVKYKILTQPEPVSLGWTDFLDMVYRLYEGSGNGDVWTAFYGKDELPVATSQQQDGTETGSTEGAAEKAPGDINEPPAAAVRKTTEPKEKPPAAAVQGQESIVEEQLPGQMNVIDYPEMLPEEMREESHGEGKGQEGTHSTDEGTEPCPGGQGDDPQGHDAFPGTPADDGCTEDPGITGMTEKEVWEEAKQAFYKLRDRFEKYRGIQETMDIGEIQAMYRGSIGLAAALEKIMMIRSRENEQKHHAQ